MALNRVLSSPLPVQAGVFLKVVFWALFFFLFSSMISQTLQKIHFISLLKTPPSAVPSVIPQISKQQLIHSLQIWIKSQAGPTLGTSFNPDKSHSHCLFERTTWNPPTPSIFSTILLKKSFHSSCWVSLSAMIFPGKATFPNWPPKPVADWTSSGVQPWRT